jgi:secondary thiamine-phosphate synthase enzyme
LDLPNSECSSSSVIRPEVVRKLKTRSFRLQLNSKQAPEFIDITEWVCQCVSQAQVDNGFAVVYSKHTTAAVEIPITITEKEPLLLADMEKFLKKISPRNDDYQHNNSQIGTVNMTPDESPNGHAQLQHLSLGSSETIPVIDGGMQFSQYQNVFLFGLDRELDRLRAQEVLVHIVGE